MTTIVPEGELVYGMQLQIQAKSKTFVEDWEADAGADELILVADPITERSIRELGEVVALLS